MNTSQTADRRMETGPILPLVFSLALPTAMAQLVNLLYNIVDRIYVGHIAGTGSLALAGLGITYPVIVLITAFGNLVGMGGSPRAAVAMGRGDYKQAEKILGNCIDLLVVLSIVLSVVFRVFGRTILLTFGASENTLPYALQYLNIYLCGTLFVQLTLGLNTFINAQGFARTAMATTVIGAVCNIILDPIFIFVFNLGVQGAAIATILSQAVSAVWILRFFLGEKSVLRLRRENFKPDFAVLGLVFSLGISPFVMNSTECLIQLVFNTGAYTYGGDEAVTIMSMLFSVTQIISLPGNGFAHGAQPVIGYNFGARRNDRVRKAFLVMFAVCLGYACLIVFAAECFPTVFLGMFTSDAALAVRGTVPLRVYVFGLSLMGAQTACQNTFLGLGEAKISIFIALLRKVILLVPLALILPHVFGLFGISQILGLYIAEPVSDCISAITCTVIFFGWEWKKLSAPQPN